MNIMNLNIAGWGKDLDFPGYTVSDTITSPRHQMHHPCKLDKSHLAKHWLNTAFRFWSASSPPRDFEGGKSYVVVSSFKCEAMWFLSCQNWKNKLQNPEMQNL